MDSSIGPVFWGSGVCWGVVGQQPYFPFETKSRSPELRFFSLGLDMDLFSGLRGPPPHSTPLDYGGQYLPFKTLRSGDAHPGGGAAETSWPGWVCGSSVGTALPLFSPC